MQNLSIIKSLVFNKNILSILNYAFHIKTNCPDYRHAKRIDFTTLSNRSHAFFTLLSSFGGASKYTTKFLASETKFV